MHRGGHQLERCQGVVGGSGYCGTLTK
jgi:hypothetical protein